MIKLLTGLFFLSISYIIGWHMLYGQFIHEWYKRNQYLLLFCSVPTTYLSVLSVKYISEYFDGEVWPNRIFTFTIGLILFTILTNFYFDEKIGYKTGTLLLLSALIVALQILWK